MAEIKEFKGMMYDSDIVGNLASVVAPHCHAAEEETIRSLYSAHPFNIVRLEYPVSKTDKEDKYVCAANTLEKWLETGIVRIDEQPGIYVYEQQYKLGNDTKRVRGIIAKVKIEEDIILPHENTNTDIYDDYKSNRYNLMQAAGASFSSIYSMYRDDDGAVAELLAVKTNAAVEFEDNFGIIHRVWAITEKERVNAIKELFENKKLVIADGHVRYETAVSFRNKMKGEVVEYTGNEDFNYCLMNLVPVGKDTPTVKAVHRLLKNRQLFDETDLLTKLEGSFSIEKSYIREYDCEKIENRLAENKEQHAMGMYTGKDYYYILTPKGGIADGINTDAQLLHKEILEKLFGINKNNYKSYIDHAASIHDGEQAVREGKANCAFYLNPLSAGELYKMAECGICVPKRTNSFYPRLMMGIIMNKFDE